MARRRSDKPVLFGSALLIVAALIGPLASENVTLTTYYPAPSGVYVRMITTGDTTLARDSGTVHIGSAPAHVGLNARLVVMNGWVGVGTPAPLSALHVANGALQINDGTEAAGRVLTSNAQGRGSWQPVLQASNFVSRASGIVAGGAGEVTATCGAGEILISGGCRAVDICSDEDTSAYGGRPLLSGNGWACPLYHCNSTQAFARCYRP